MESKNLDQYAEYSSTFTKVYYGDTDMYFWDSDSVCINIYTEEDDPYHYMCVLDRYTTFLFLRNGGINVFNYDETDKADIPVLERPDIMEINVDRYLRQYSKRLSEIILSGMNNPIGEEMEIYKFSNCQIVVENMKMKLIFENQIIELIVNENNEFIYMGTYMKNTTGYIEEKDRLMGGDENL